MVAVLLRSVNTDAARVNILPCSRAHRVYDPGVKSDRREALGYVLMFAVILGVLIFSAHGIGGAQPDYCGQYQVPAGYPAMPGTPPECR